jgi:MFS family permease
VKKLPRNVVWLGVVSLLTDVSSEMIYPLLPAFLITLGAGGTFVGLVEGVAETTSSVFKLLSGWWADRVRHKKPLVVLGYALASVARPLSAIAAAPWHVLAIRFADRVGKGLRTSPRDALIAEAADEAQRGAAFGYHRAMDHAGAILGTLFAFVLVSGLSLAPRAVFACAAVPALLALFALLVGVRETGALPRRPEPRAAGASPLPRRLLLYLVLVGLFTLANSSDMFLLLRAHELGVPLALAPLLWALLHVLKSLLSTSLGALSDRVGRLPLIAAGWLVYALTYAGFAVATQAWQVWGLFVLYGAYAALAEGAEKALVADLAPEGARGRAFGAFHFVVGITALPASLGFGVVWDRVGHGAAFGMAAVLAGAATTGLALLRGARKSA